MKVPERVPWIAGSAFSSGAWSTCQAGVNVSRVDAVGRRNMLYTNSACQAFGVTNRMPMRWLGSAPANRSRTNRSRSFRWRITSACSRSKCAGARGWFTRPHQTSPSDAGSRTRNLSLGLRPVCGAVTAQNGPPSTMRPSLRRAACSYSAGGPRFQWTALFGASPSPSSPSARRSVSCAAWVACTVIRRFPGGSRPRPAPVLLGVDRRDDGHVHDIVHVRTPLQDVDRLGHPHQDRPDRLGAADAVQQLVADVRGVQVG